MTEFTRTSNVVAGGGSIGRAIDENRGAHLQRRREPKLTCVATALAALLVAGTSVQALAQAEKDRVSAGCVLGTDAGGTVEDLEADVLKVPGILDNADLQVAFVVVYSLKNDNDGQPVTDGFTGPVICTNPEFVLAPVPTDQTEDIGEVGDTVTILDAEEAFLLQYQFETGPMDIEKRVCHTVNANTDCFLIVPAPPPLPD